jgi:lipopolysaccharide transport system permease protein
MIHTDTAKATEFQLVIEPKSGWQIIDWYELYNYRDLFRFLVWRGIKARYAQSVIGVGWAVIQPVVSMLLFTIIFGKLAKVSSDGVPYALFSFAALVPWTYFSNAVTEASGSLVTNANMISKVYFPRLVLPTASVLSKLVDFSISFGVLVVLMLIYRVLPPVQVIFLPVLIFLMMTTASGLGMWLTALSVQYRDIKHSINFVMQLLMYASPVVYPASLVPEQYQWAYALNPMVGVIEGFRSCLLNSRSMPWGFILIGTVSASLILISGMLYFRRREKLFADVA